MLLPLAFDDPFTPPAVDPALQAIEFIDCGLVRLLQLRIRSGCFIEHAFQLRRFSESCQQKLVALGKIVGKSVGVIHHAHCFNDFYE